MFMPEKLLVVDVQNDFCDGALPVKGYRNILEPIRKLIVFRFGLENTYFTFDSHPADHCSFRENGGMFRKFFFSTASSGVAVLNPSSDILSQDLKSRELSPPLNTDKNLCHGCLFFSLGVL